MNIEKFNEKHNLRKILEIDIEAVKDFFVLVKDKYNQDELRNISQIQENSKGEYFLGILEEEIVAICGYKIKDNENVELRRFRVSKKIQNRGYGSQLLNFVEERIKNKGFIKINLETAALRESTLLFYEKRNYINVGEKTYGQIKTIKFEKNI